MLMLGKTEGRRKRGQQRIRWLDGITKSMNISWASSGSWWYTGKPSVLQSMGLLGHDWATELNWTELNRSEKIECWKRKLRKDFFKCFSIITETVMIDKAWGVSWWQNLDRWQYFPFTFHIVSGFALFLHFFYYGKTYIM